MLARIQLALAGLTHPADAHEIATADPLAHTYLRAPGRAGLWGWPDDPKIESLRNEWIAANDPVEQKRLAEALQVEAFQNVPYLPLGIFYTPTAYRMSVTGMLKGIPIFWNLKKA